VVTTLPASALVSEPVSTSAEPTRRVPDFLLMVIVVAVVLVAGGLALAFLPRSAPPTRPVAALTTPPRVDVTTEPTVTATPSPSVAPASEQCTPDPDTAGRLVALPLGATATPTPELAGRTDPAKMSVLWHPSDPSTLQNLLRDKDFRSCAFRVWSLGPTTVTVAVFALGSEREAREIRDLAADDLYYRPHDKIDFFDWDREGLDRWVEEVHDDGSASLAGVFAVGQYVSFVRLGPVHDGQDLATFFSIARTQHDRLGPA
jgi:hypothetical protein